MSAKDLVPWFQMGSTILTGIGVIVSISLGIVSLSNNRRERLEKIRPNLFFNVGGQQVAARIDSLSEFPGIDADDWEAKKFRETLPEDHKCLVLEGEFGQLYNHGSGIAIGTYIWFEPEKICTGERERWLRRQEKLAPPYTMDWNTILATPVDIPPDSSARFGIAPISVYVAAPDITELSGKIKIECRDSEGNAFRWTQPVTFFIDRIDANRADVTVSFGARTT